MSGVVHSRHYTNVVMGGGGGGGARDMYEAIGERVLALTRTTAEHKEPVEGM